jgi:hypothetical protein
MRFIADSAPDALWQSDAPTEGAVQANAAVAIEDARSTAVLQLPAGARVLYARLYWASHMNESLSPAEDPVLIERPGSAGFSVTLRPDPVQREVATTLGGGFFVYQSTKDVTALVQKYGPGAYRVGNAVRNSVGNRDQDVLFAAWAMVVVFRSSTAPAVRNIALFDGLDSVSLGTAFSLSFSGFNVPMIGTPSGKLGLLAYDGDSDKTESLAFNMQAVSDAQNPQTNVFNSSRSELGQPVSVLGDLPQLTGAQGSMSGVDIDVIDISGLLKQGTSTATISASVTDDIFFLGGLFTSIVHHRPVIETTLLSKPTSVGPGGTLNFTSITANIGDDDGVQLLVRHPLPRDLIYVPGSLRYVSGPPASPLGAMSDQAGDDAAELVVDSMTGLQTLILRLGANASAKEGGRLSPSDAAVVVTYQLRTADSATGDIATASTTEVVPAAMSTLPAQSFPSGDGINLAVPTVVHVPATTTDLKVAVQKSPPKPGPSTQVSYHVEIKNVGQTTDPGPLRVTLSIPTGYVLNSMQPAVDGGTCSQLAQTVVCLLPTSLEPGVGIPVVDLTVTTAASPDPASELTVVVCSDGAIDANPADNTWHGLFNEAYALGGASDCAYADSARLGSPFLLGLTAWLLLVWRRRRRPSLPATGLRTDGQTG